MTCRRLELGLKLPCSLTKELKKFICSDISELIKWNLNSFKVS